MTSTPTTKTTKRGRGRPRKTDGPKLPAASKAKKIAVPAIDSLPTNPFVFEVLDLTSKQKSSDKKVEALKQYEHDCIKMVLIWNFDKSIISLLPEGEVPYGRHRIKQYIRVVCQKIFLERQQVVNQQLDKTLMVEVEHL